MSVVRSHLLPHISYVCALSVVFIYAIVQLKRIDRRIPRLWQKRDHALKSVIACEEINGRLTNTVSLMGKAEVNGDSSSMREFKRVYGELSDKIQASKVNFEKLTEAQGLVARFLTINENLRLEIDHLTRRDLAELTIFRRFDLMEAANESLREQAERDLGELSTAIRQAHSDLYNKSYIAFVVMVFLSLAYLYTVNWLLARPIRILTLTSRSVTGGRLDARANVTIDGPVSQLAEDFNKMIDMLVQSLNEQERAVYALRVRTRELQAANEHKNRFIANISHELKTPLNAIIGFADILLAQHHGELSPRQADYLKRIYGAGDHLLAMICDLIDVMKLDLNALNLKIEEFDAGALTNEIVELVMPQVQKKEHEMKVRIEPDLPKAQMDPTRYKQILMNLLSNSIKFTPSEGKIGVRLELVDGNFRLTVSDNGIGISKADQQRIFQDFTQLDSKLHRQHEGTGIGLALTRRLVTLMGGSMDVQSKLGRGSRFTALLPIKTPAPEEETKDEPGKKEEKKRLRLDPKRRAKDPPEQRKVESLEKDASEMKHHETESIAADPKSSTEVPDATSVDTEQKSSAKPPDATSS